MQSSGLLVAALLLGAATPALSSKQDYCMAHDPNPFANFGTRAPYEVSGPNLDATPVRIEGCRAVHLWYLGRHGTRHGKAADIDLILGLTKLKTRIASLKADGQDIQLCEADLQNILNWYPNVDKSLAYQLTAQGQQDGLQLGERLRKRFPDLFEGNTASNFKFMYDESDRCIATSQWFYRGIFGRFPEQGEGTIDSMPDFYNRCPAFLIPVGTDYLTGDFNKFRKRSEWDDMVRRASSRLGFHSNLDVDEINALYAACSYERAREWSSGKYAPWCAAFRAEDFEVLEYWFDMKEFYRTGYGHKVHQKLGCVPIKDLFKTFLQRAQGRQVGPASGTIYHSHDTLLNQVITFLGLYHDSEKLEKDNFARQRNRKWRVTEFSPFGSNLAAVLWDCAGGADRFRVQMFLNEKLLPLADWGCDRDSCTWAQFAAKFKHLLSDCKKARLCIGL